MATDTAALAPTAEPARRVWQVPVFLLGAGAFVAAWQGWLPLPAADPASAFRRDVDGLLAAAGKGAPDVAELRVALDRVARAADAYPEQAAATHFSLGSGWVRLAELTADPAEARNHWVLAREHFDAVRREALTDPAVQPRFEFRAAKARAATLATDARPDDLKLLHTLLVTPPTGEAPGDAPRLAAEIGLKAATPDLKGAKLLLTGYVADAGPATPPATVARAKLRLGEVLVGLDEPDGAKKWLGQVGADAPPEVVAAARSQLAFLRMREHDWAGAAKDWEAARATRQGLKDQKLTASAFHLGVCKLKADGGNPAVAAKLFEDAAAADTAEGRAAAVRLAELKLKAPEPARHKEAAGHLAAAVKGVNGPAEYANPFAPLTDVQAAFELAVQALTAGKAYDAAVATADAYRAVAAAGRDRERRAEALAAHGTELQRINADGSAKFAAAAKEYADLAARRDADTDKADLLRRAAGLYRKANDGRASLAALEQVIALRGLPDEAAGPAWVDYAEGLLTADRPAEALKAFRQAMATSAPASTAARHRLARLLLDTRDPKKAPLGIALLEQIASAERVAPAEQAAHERALVELAHEDIRARQYAGAEARLRTQLQLYPAGAESDLGRVLLGSCLLERAHPDAKPRAADPAKAREEAVGLFKKVQASTEARKGPSAPEADKWLRTWAGLRLLKAYVAMGQPQDVLAEGGRLRGEVSGTVEELFVLSLMHQAFKQMPRNAGERGAVETRSQMKDLFDALKDKPGVFWAATGEYSRAFWDEWFK